MTTQFYRIIDRKSENSAMSNDGGDYDFGRIVAVQDGNPVAVRFWTSADFDYCPLCGNFDRHSVEDCPAFGAEMREADGWQNGELLTGATHDNSMHRLNNGGFNPIRKAVQVFQ